MPAFRPTPASRAALAWELPARAYWPEPDTPPGAEPDVAGAEFEPASEVDDVDDVAEEGNVAWATPFAALLPPGSDAGVEGNDGFGTGGVETVGVGTGRVVIVGTVTVGTVTVGTVTVGTLTVGTLTVGTLTVGTLTVGTLTVGTLTVGTEIAMPALGSAPKIGRSAAANTATPTTQRPTHANRCPAPAPRRMPTVLPLISRDIYPFSLRSIACFEGVLPLAYERAGWAAAAAS